MLQLDARIGGDELPVDGDAGGVARVAIAPTSRARVSWSSMHRLRHWPEHTESSHSAIPQGDAKRSVQPAVMFWCVVPAATELPTDPARDAPRLLRGETLVPRSGH